MKNVRDDLENNFRSVLQTGLDKLDLVTREEFEVQQAVLAKAREKLKVLESRLAEMEEGSDGEKTRKKTAKKTAKDKVKKKR